MRVFLVTQYQDLAEQRAPYDLQCETKDIKFVQLSQGVVGAEGCGKRATYTYVDGAGWIMDNASVSESVKE